MLKTYRSWFWLSIAWLAVMLPSALLADVTGSILGTVSDSSSAVIQGARVTATNLDRNLVVETTSDENGQFRILALPVGRYRLGVSFAGFRTFVQTGIVLSVNDQRRVDVVLQVGETHQEISVSDAAVHVETTNTQMGEVIGGAKMAAMPLNGRSYTDLLALQPGVVPIGSGSYSSPAVSGNLNAGNLSVSGMREGSNGFMVNGGAAQEVSSMGTAIVPNLDSIAEFRILTNNADAEYGNYSGGLVNVITKSGTNKFHGNLFEYLRNSSMDARSFFSPKRGILRQNEFGGVVGGPIRRDKVFFFGDYQGHRRTVGVDLGLVAVPSVANKQGDMRDVASKLTGTVKGSAWATDLSTRLGYAVTPGEPYYTPGCTSSANCVFPNAIIPQSAFSAPGKNLIKYIPDPNLGSNYTTSAFPSTLRDDKWSTRIDANTRIGMLSGYFFLDDYTLLNPFPVNIPGFEATSNGRAQMANVGLTKSFGANSVNELRLIYMRNVNFVNQPRGGVGTTLGSLGFTLGSGTGSSFNGGIVAIGPEAVPKIGMNNFTFGAVQESTLAFTNTYQILDNFSKVIGPHTVKFGGNTRLDQFKREGIGTAYWTGVFNFNGNETGYDIADLLLGAPFQYQVVAVEPVHLQSHNYGLYIQDSWRARPQLTVNYGLRWDVASPWYEVFGRQQAFVLGMQSKIFPGSPKGWVFPGDPGIPKTISPVRYKNFAPRLGLAYAPTAQEGFLGKLFGGPGKTSIRAAVGLYYTGFESRYIFQIQGDAPFGNAYSSPVPPRLDTPFIDRQNGNNQGQRVPIVFPAFNVSQANPDNTIDWSIFLPISGSPTWDPTNHVPYAAHYNFSLQRQFGTNTVASLSYVGTQGHRLLGAIQNNPGNPALCLSVSQPSQVMPGTPTCGPGGANGVYYPITGGVINSTRGPYGPNFGSNALFSTIANSSYNAFETTLRHTSGRMDFLAAYTWSKSLDNSSSWGNNGAPTGGDMVNFFNPRLSRSLSAFDMTHNFVVSYSYQLPFDKLWRPNRLTSGWRINGITRFSTGLPVTLHARDDQSLTGTASAGGVGHLDIPNYTPGDLNITDPQLANRSANVNPYFNKALFTKPALGQLGNANKRFFHGPGLNNWDMGLMKDLRLTESKTLQFRAEFFNIFNHAQFGLPQGNFLNSAFGYVTSVRSPRIGQVSMRFSF